MGLPRFGAAAPFAGGIIFRRAASLRVHFHEQFVIGEAVLFQQILDAQISVQQIPGDVLQTDGVYIIKEGHSHVFLEEAGEVIGVQGYLSRNLIQGDILRIVLPHIGGDMAQPADVFGGAFLLGGAYIHPEKGHQFIEQLENQAVEPETCRGRGKGPETADVFKTVPDVFIFLRMTARFPGGGKPEADPVNIRKIPP